MFRIAIDAPAFGLPVAGEIALHRAQRGRVGPTGVAVDALQPHRAIRERGVEIGRAREALFRPVVLVPSATDDPRTRRELYGVFAQARDDVGLVARADQVGADHRRTEATHVSVRIDQAGHDGRLAGIDAPGVRILLQQRSGLAQREQPALRVVRQRLHLRPCNIHRVDARGGDHRDIRSPGLAA